MLQLVHICEPMTVRIYVSYCYIVQCHVKQLKVILSNIRAIW